MTTYITEFCDKSHLPKKLQKNIENEFPFKAPENPKTMDLIGKKCEKKDASSTIKFCPLCDYPMIVRIMFLPCSHVICYECSKPENENCYVCEMKITERKRLADNKKLYECDVPDCFKFFLDELNLKTHKVNEHGLHQDGVSVPNLLGLNMMPMNIGNGFNPAMGVMGNLGMVNFLGMNNNIISNLNNNMVYRPQMQNFN